ncbi:FAD-dependent monooxygenase [Actinomadura sp. J1-007]|uniref:FAD-dependent monooxygenase n=1 Tax=Actinomadura sp. J1-007 TaxID=2661913 RepID=UPI0019D5B1D8|nr:FAD-dependent monooxygenase [Actinomadura sp. J1-007]
MTSTSPPMDVMKRTVLISGASISGPALAYWLHRSGFAVTVVEKAGALRGGGYPIDVRGTAIEVARRMGILPQLQEAHIDSRRCTFLNADGSRLVSVPPSAVSGGTEEQDVEVRRGDLAAILYALVRDDVEFMFGDSIDTLDQSERGVDVAFRSGRRRTFDLVIGADGMHSHTREVLFGPKSGSTATSATASPYSRCRTRSGSPTSSHCGTPPEKPPPSTPSETTTSCMPS